MSVLDDLEFTSKERVHYCGNLESHSPHDTGQKTGCPGGPVVIWCSDTNAHVPHMVDEKRCMGYIRNEIKRGIV